MNHPCLRHAGCGSHDSMRAEKSTRGRSQSPDESNDTTGSARPVEERPIECQPLVDPSATRAPALRVRKRVSIPRRLGGTVQITGTYVSGCMSKRMNE